MGLVRIRPGGELGLDADSRASEVSEQSEMNHTRDGPVDLGEAAAIAAFIRIAGVVTFGRLTFAGTGNALTPGSAGSLFELAGVGAGSTLTAVPITSGASAATCVAEQSPDPRLYRE